MNKFDEGNRHFFMKDHKFLPSIEMRLTSESSEVLNKIDNDEDYDLFGQGYKLAE